MCVMHSTNELYCNALVKYQRAWEADGVVNRGEMRKHTSDTSRIPVLCLSGRMFGLESAASPGSTGILDLRRFARDEEFSSVGSNGNQRIRFTQVNANSQNPLRVWKPNVRVARPINFPSRTRTLRQSISVARSKSALKSSEMK